MPVLKLLAWPTLRDFFARAAAVLIGAGWAGFVLKAFLIIVTGWLIVVVAVMRRQA